MYHQSSNTSSSIQGKVLEVTVVRCHKLKDTEWMLLSRQDPYVCVEYGSTKFRTRTCTDGGINPSFEQKFVFTLTEGLRELTVLVWNSNTLSYDDLIGSGKVQLEKVLTQGYDDSSWSIQSKNGRHSGEVQLTLHYPSAISDRISKTEGASAPLYVAPQVPQAVYYAPPQPPSVCHYHQQPYLPPQTAYSPLSSGYPPPPCGCPQHSAYPPAYLSAYLPQPSAYPPQPSAYPPQSTPYYSPGPYPLFPTR